MLWYPRFGSIIWLPLSSTNFEKFLSDKSKTEWHEFSTFSHLHLHRNSASRLFLILASSRKKIPSAHLVQARCRGCVFLPCELTCSSRSRQFRSNFGSHQSPARSETTAPPLCPQSLFSVHCVCQDLGRSRAKFANSTRQSGCSPPPVGRLGCPLDHKNI
ncbi:hypothetical protein BpHYR1_034173 [Brachionus plicatilis]|uniref:Uncharacterized protein n=1 Tax=Brachionus plicatilis TaxID=10195 RepID=A0A3M7QK73_BRAPC|nr:hypothetical protein BpHYR1_034173 [Brachionus plicatilis]